MLSLHSSDLALYRKCPAKFLFTHQGLAGSRARINAKMLYGSLWHAKFVSYYGCEPAAAAFERTALELQPEARSLALELWAEIEQDFEWYLEAQARTLQIKEIMWIERAGASLALPVDEGLEILFTPDLVAYVEADWGGGLCVIDHKTHGVLHETASGPRYEPAPREMTLMGYFHSRQFPTYIGAWNRIAAEAEGTSTPRLQCETAILNLVPQRVTHVLQFLTSRRGTPKLPEVRREVIPYDTSACERLVVEAIHTAREIREKLDRSSDVIREIAETEVWPQHDNSCLNFNEVCPFLELCEAGDSTRAAIIESYTPKLTEEE
jgi:hypothetical protein